MLNKYKQKVASGNIYLHCAQIRIDLPVGIHNTHDYPPNAISAMRLSLFVLLVLLLSKVSHASASWDWSWNQDSSNNTTTSNTNNNQSTTTEVPSQKSNNASPTWSLSSIMGWNSDMGCTLEMPNSVKDQREARGEPLGIIADIQVRKTDL